MAQPGELTRIGDEDVEPGKGIKIGGVVVVLAHHSRLWPPHWDPYTLGFGVPTEPTGALN